MLGLSKYDDTFCIRTMIQDKILDFIGGPMDNPYDRIPYLGRAHQQTHIEKIATIPHMFGLKYPSIHRTRVLELGCGDGTNILNMAYMLPNSDFVGIDGSNVQIERGRKSKEIAGLKNIRLIHSDLRKIGTELGMFDYIICHGVYSWVPEPVRKHILNICKKQLQPNGIAYISYNALPGWRMFGMIRDMMRYHVRNIDDDSRKIEQSIAMLQFVGQHQLDPLSSYGSFVREQMNHLSKSTSEYLFHEYLEDCNQAFYFHEFVDDIANVGLQYLGETDFTSMNNIHYPAQTQELLNEISNNIHSLEQYMDFLRFRRFRCSLLTHDNLSINREVTLDPFTDAHFTLTSLHSYEYNLPSRDILNNLLKHVYIDSHNKHLNEIPIFAQCLTSIFEAWPKYIHFNDICAQVEKKQELELTQQERVEIAALLQTLILQNEMSIHLLQPEIAASISDTPKASPLSRAQIRYQNGISTQHHTMISLRDSWTHTLLPFLDGEHNIKDLLSLMEKHHKEANEPESDNSKNPEEQLHSFLQILWQRGVLIA